MSAPIQPLASSMGTKANEIAGRAMENAGDTTEGNAQLAVAMLLQSVAEKAFHGSVLN